MERERGLAAGFDKVLVVATDEKALEKVEKEFGRAGLIIAGRVRLLLRGRYVKSTAGTPSTL